MSGDVVSPTNASAIGVLLPAMQLIGSFRRDAVVSSDAALEEVAAEWVSLKKLTLSDAVRQHLEHVGISSGFVKSLADVFASMHTSERAKSMASAVRKGVQPHADALLKDVQVLLFEQLLGDEF